MTVRLVDPPRPPPAPRELLFEFLIEHARHRCELVDHGDYGVEALFLKNEEMDIGRTFHQRLDPTRTPRAMAIAWAQEWRAGTEADAVRKATP